MADPSTWIKVDRNILKWRWYQDANTYRVFLHLILNANIEDHDFMMITVKRGQLVTSRRHLAEQLNLTQMNVRTALQHLKATKQITTKGYPKFTVITVVQYDKYQSDHRGKQPTANQQPTSNQPATNHNQRSKEYKKLRSKERDIPALSEVEAYAAETGSAVDPKRFFEKQSAVGWMSGGQPVTDWRALFRSWNDVERNPAQAKQTRFDQYGQPIKELE